MVRRVPLARNDRRAAHRRLQLQGLRHGRGRKQNLRFALESGKLLHTFGPVEQPELASQSQFANRREEGEGRGK